MHVYMVLVSHHTLYNIHIMCRTLCSVSGMEAVVLFDYEKQQDDELDLQVGMTIQNVIQVLYSQWVWAWHNSTGSGCGLKDCVYIAI